MSSLSDSVGWSVVIASVLALAACSDEGESTGSGGGTTTSADGGGNTGGASQGGASTGGASAGGAAQGGASQGGGSTGGAAPFGPCHGIVETFESFDLTSTTDAWETEGTLSLTTGNDKALVAAPDADGYAGLYTSDAAVSENCYFDVAVEDPQADGAYVIEMLEAGDTGRKVLIEIVGADFTVANIVNGAGDGDVLGTGTIDTALRGLRMQVKDDALVFEVKDTTGWHAAATMSPAPSWITSPTLLGFGYRSDLGDAATFDDVNVEAPE